jgi:hypothetical protein
MARIAGVLKALGLASWREVRSFGSIGGQNLFLFALFVAFQQLESAAFFALLLVAVLLFPLATNPLENVPAERRMTWPLLPWEWGVVRAASLLLSPFVWVAAFFLVRSGWRMGAQVCLCGLALYLLKLLFRQMRLGWRVRLPALPGAIGSLMRIQWRGMLHTLDPYVAFVLMAATTLYRIFGKPLDPAAPRIIALVVALAISTQGQVLFGIDGAGAQRYRQLPLRGWRILLAKDLAFLVLLALLVAPLDFVSGMFGGLAALVIGHHRSVLNPAPQRRWRFTSGALAMDGILQTMALFAVGNVVREEGFWLMAACIAAWAASVVWYGRAWDRVA